MRDTVKSGAAAVIGILASIAIGGLFTWQLGVIAFVICVALWLVAHFWPSTESRTGPTNDDGVSNTVSAGRDLTAGRDIHINQRGRATRDDDTQRIIRDLTAISLEWSQLKDHPGGAGWVGIFIPSDEGPTESELKSERDRAEYAKLEDRLSGRVRQVLDEGAPEYLAEWHATNLPEKPQLLLRIIRELRVRQ